MTPDDFVVEDYKLKLDYLKTQFDRLWTRFNFFLTIEVGLFGFLGWMVFEKENPSASRVPAAIGLAVSVLWYVFAAEDRALVDSYRDRTTHAAEEIAKRWPSDFSAYPNDHVAAEQGNVWTSPVSWYWKPISITRLPVLVSLLLIAVWLVLVSAGPVLFASLLKK